LAAFLLAGFLAAFLLAGFLAAFFFAADFFAPFRLALRAGRRRRLAPFFAAFFAAGLRAAAFLLAGRFAAFLLAGFFAVDFFLAAGFFFAADLFFIAIAVHSLNVDDSTQRTSRCDHSTVQHAPCWQRVPDTAVLNAHPRAGWEKGRSAFGPRAEVTTGLSFRGRSTTDSGAPSFAAFGVHQSQLSAPPV